jgi:hypothetical protein
MEEMRMMLVQRLSYWRSRLDKAERRYHSAARSISEQQRQGYLAECKIFRAVLAELELLEGVFENGTEA